MSLVNQEVINKVCNNIENFTADIGFTTETGDPLLLTKYQADFARKIIKRESKKHIFVSCTGGGKTESTSIIAILLAVLYDGEKIIITSPTFRQSERLFGRIRSHVFGSKHFLYPLIDRSKPFTKQELHFLNGSSVVCLSAGNPDIALGWGASCLIIDESGSVEDVVYKTRLLRMLVRKIKHDPLLILLGTPHTLNFFYEAHESKQFDITRVNWKMAVEAGRLNKDEVEFNRKTMSPEEFKVWYEAEFHNINELALFDMEKVMKAQIIERLSMPDPNYDYYAGLDVARYGGDQSALVFVGVNKALGFKAPIEMHQFKVRSGFSITEVAGWTINELKIWKPKALVVDSIGLGGGEYDVLKEEFNRQSLDCRIIAFDFVGRERSECYLYLKQLLDDKIESTDYTKIMLPRSDQFREQFKGYTANLTKEGRLKIEKAENARDDIVDALTYALYPVRLRKMGDVDIMPDLFKELLNNGTGEFGFRPRFGM